MSSKIKEKQKRKSGKRVKKADALSNHPLSWAWDEKEVKNLLQTISSSGLSEADKVFYTYVVSKRIVTLEIFEEMIGKLQALQTNEERKLSQLEDEFHDLEQQQKDRLIRLGKLGAEALREMMNAIEQIEEKTVHAMESAEQEQSASMVKALQSKIKNKS